MATIPLETEKYYWQAEAAYEKRLRAYRRREAILHTVMLLAALAGVAVGACLRDFWPAL